MNNAMAIGVGCGIVVGLIVAFVLKMVMKTDGSLKNKYDERQEQVRGRGFKYGFFTLLIYFGVYGYVEMAVEKMPIDNITGCVIGILLGVMVYACYSIWNDGYFALNDNRKRVLIMFAVIAAMNFLIAGMNMMHVEMIQDGVLTYRSTNVFCGFSFVVIAIVLFLKERRAQKEDE